MKEKICLLLLCLFFITTVACADKKEQGSASQDISETRETLKDVGISENNEKDNTTQDNSSETEGSLMDAEETINESYQMATGDNKTSAAENEYREGSGEEIEDTGSSDEEVRGTYDAGNYAKYKNAYINSTTAGLSGDEITFFNNLKNCLDGAVNYTRMVDKEKAVYDWIILNCHYDTASNHGAYTYKPEGVFIYGEAVCDGYTKAMKLCMDILEIPCTRVVGYATGGLHSWNNIKLDDGCWYELDVTWGDPLPDRQGRVSYKYFNVTSEYMSGTHYNYESNNCTATQYSYWNTYSNETYIKDYDEFYEYITDMIKNGRTSDTIAFEHIVCNDFESAYDYTYVYSQTGVNAIYTIDKIYEDNGTTHFPNGAEYADIAISYGTLDEEEINFINSQDDLDSIIMNISPDAEAGFCFCISAENYAKGDFSKQHILDMTAKSLSYYYISKETYNYLIHVGFCYNEEEKLATSLEQIDELVDGMMSRGETEMMLIYYYGENSSRTDTVHNRIATTLQAKYGLRGNEYAIDFYSLANKSYRVTISIRREGV